MTESRYCEEWPRHFGKPDRIRPKVPLCKPGETPDVPSLTACPACGGRVVRSKHGPPSNT